MNDNELKNVATNVRLDIFRMFRISGRGHLASALSCVDILVSLYFAPVINLERKFSSERDRVILSKGHGCAALYAVLAEAGYFQKEMLRTFYQYNSLLGGHPSAELSGIETATGALGHGICFGTGTAMAAKLSGSEARTYVLIGDGESEEGTVWEAAMFAGNHCLDNLTVILDRNRLQASTWVDEIAPINPVEKKWEAFGWHVLEVDGHDFKEMRHVFNQAKEWKKQPTIVVANTIKGKGVSFIENNPMWHSRAPKDEEWNVLCSEYGISMEDLQS